MRRLLAMVLVCAATVSGQVSAAALGDMTVNSYLNQRLDARIELHAVREGDLAGMKVRLPDEAAFEAAGLVRYPALSDLRFAVVETGPGQGYIRVSSKDRVREPSLEFLVEITWDNGRAMRKYAVLLVAQ